MVWVRVPAPYNAEDVSDVLRKGGVGVFGGKGREMRFVCHRDVGREGVEVCRDVLGRWMRKT